MNIEGAQAFIREHHHAVLATRRSDGRPQMSPIVCSIGDDGAVWVSSRETAVKTKNLRRDPQASLCVLSDEFMGEWVQVDGRAEIVSLPDAMEMLVDYYRSISGEHPDWDEYRAAMQTQHRVILRITIERAGPSVSG